MPRKNPVPKREREICQRLFDFRRRTKLTRAAVAGELGITPSRLSNYEHGAVPVPYGVASRIADLLGLNLEWLAAGIGNPQDVIAVGSAIDAEIPSRMLLSGAYDRFIKPALTEERKQGPTGFEVAVAQQPGLPYKITPIRTIGIHDQETTKRLVTKIAEAYLSKLPPHLLYAYYQALVGAASEFVSSHAGEINSPSAGKATVKDILDKHQATVSVTSMSSGVPTWPQLKKEIARLTSRRGAKTALAGELGVSRQVLGNWLSDDDQGAPSAALTLRLLKWVNDQKRKQ